MLLFVEFLLLSIGYSSGSTFPCSAPLAPLLPELVSPSQSAFIKRRCIHDNFLHVQGLIKEMHTGVFLKAWHFQSVWFCELALPHRATWGDWFWTALETMDLPTLVYGNLGGVAQWEAAAGHSAWAGLEAGWPNFANALHSRDWPPSPPAPVGDGGWHPEADPSTAG